MGEDSKAVVFHNTFHKLALFQRRLLPFAPDFNGEKLPAR
jgi:hypothetical protein